MAKNIWDVTAKLLGDPPRGGVGRKSGISRRNAIDAGVVKDVPAPASWRKLADDLKKLDDAKNPQEKPPGFAEKFPVRGGVVEMTAQDLADMLDRTEKLGRLKKAGATAIKFTSDLGGSAIFRFIDKRPDDIGREDILDARQVVVSGPSILLANTNEKLILWKTGRPVARITDIVSADEAINPLVKHYGTLLSRAKSPKAVLRYPECLYPPEKQPDQIPVDGLRGCFEDAIAKRKAVILHGAEVEARAAGNAPFLLGRAYYLYEDPKVRLKAVKCGADFRNVTLADLNARLETCVDKNMNADQIIDTIYRRFDALVISNDRRGSPDIVLIKPGLDIGQPK